MDFFGTQEPFFLLFIKDYLKNLDLVKYCIYFSTIFWSLGLGEDSIYFFSIIIFFNIFST